MSNGQQPGTGGNNPKVGVLLVHGMGRHQKGDTLEPWVAAVSSWMRHRAEKGDQIVVRNVEYHDDDAKELFDRTKPPEAWLEYNKKSGTPALATWHVVEAWWEKSFKPPQSGDMLWYAMVQFPRQMWKLVRRFWTAIVSPTPKRTSTSNEPRPDISRPTGLFLGVEAFISGLLYVCAFVLATLCSPVLFLLMYALIPLASVPGVGKVAPALTGFLNSFLIDSLGDIYSFVTDDVRASRIIAQFNAAADKLIDCDEIIIVSHSTGTIISYEALVQGQNDKLLWVAKVTKLVTVAEIFTWSWDLKPRPTFYELLPQNIKWYNIYSLYDPAVNGSFQSGIPKKPRLPINQRPSCELAVTNERSIIRDHSSYFENYDQVVRFIVALMAEPSKTVLPRLRESATGRDGNFADLDSPGLFHQKNAGVRMKKVWPLLSVRLIFVLIFPGLLIAFLVNRGLVEAIANWRYVAAGLDFFLGKLTYLKTAIEQRAGENFAWLQNFIGVVVVVFTIGLLALVLFTMIKAVWLSPRIAGRPTAFEK